MSTEFPWHVHSVLDSSTARVDIKASILLAFQGGGFIFATTSRDLVLTAPQRWPVIVGAVAMGLLIAAMSAAAAATLPTLGSTREHRRRHDRNMVYFGHLRLWRPAELADRLVRLTPGEETEMLALQLIALSKLNWRKHRLLQVSVVLMLLAWVSLTVAVIVPRV